MLHLKGNKRLKGESFKKYKERRKAEAKLLKRYLKGVYIWLATSICDRRGIVHTNGQGTYSRKKHGEIGTIAFKNQRKSV